MQKRPGDQRALTGMTTDGSWARVVRAIVGIVAVLAVGIGMQTPSAARADASSQPSMSITALTPSSQASGVAFGYNVTYACSNVNADPCAENPVIRIPLGAAAGMDVKVGANALIRNWSIVAGVLVIELDDLVQGTSGNVGITITPPNHTTPNGTNWTLTPTMTFSDGTPTVTAPGVTSTATAQPSIDVRKTSDVAFYVPGATVNYTLWWDCPLAAGSTGVEDLTKLVLVDTLPAGLTYASSSPTGAVVAGQTVTFTLTPAQVGERCSQGNGLAVPVTVSAKVNANVADGTVLVNTVSATGTSLSNRTVTSSASASITVVASLPGATVSKLGYGPLLNTVGDGAYDLNLNGYRSATYPGAWLGRGVAATPSPSAYVFPSSATDFRIEAVYSMRVDLPASGMQFALTDPMPCNTNVSGALYSSYPVGGTLCTDPAFNPTLITIDTRAGAGGVGVPDALVVRARLIDGSVIDLDRGGDSGEAQANGPSFRTYRVPNSAVGSVAELIFPRTAGMTSARTDIYVGGYVDEARSGGNVIRNRGGVNSYLVGDAAAFATGTTSIGSIYVKQGPQIGVTKYYVPTDKGFQFSSETFLPGPTSGDLTYTDTLPAGWTVTGPVTARVWKYGTSSWTMNLGITSTTSIDPATGRTILTVTVPKTTINALLRPGPLGDRLRFEILVPSVPPFPGNYSNTATVNLSDPQTGDICTTGTRVAGTAGAGMACSATTNFTVNPDPMSAAVRVTKSVRGSLDTAFKTFPAIGYVAAAGGDATFRLGWTNKSIASMNGVVAYDLLPRVGDTGTVAGTLQQQRGSTFRPTLTSISALPAGMTAYYSTSVNPCRAEVLPNAQNLGCADDWIAMPASPGATLLSSVRALKFVSTTTYAFDQGFSIDIGMTTPPLANASDAAWNTFATAQKNAATGQTLPPVETARVGISRQDFSHITIDKIVDKATANVGDTLTYTVTAVNDGGRDLTDITLRDTLPAGATFVSASGGGVHAGGVVTWNLANMPLGQLYSFTVAVRVAQDGATLVNRWGVDGETPVTPLHPCVAPNANHESCATTTVPAVALTFGKTADPVAGTMVKPGDTVTYAVTVSNATANTSTGGEVTDDMSEVLDKATLVTPPVVTCAPTANSCGEVQYAAGDTGFTWSSSPTAPLAGNTVATIRYTVKVDDDATGTLKNLLVEPGVVVEHPILTVDKTVDKGDGALVNPGDTVKYTLTITNSGAVASNPFSVSDDLSDVVDNATFDDASIVVTPAIGSAVFDAATERLTWTGALTAGQTVRVSYTVTVNDDAHGELRNVFLDKTVVNPLSGSLRWDKVDDSPDAGLLAGAEWTLRQLIDGEPLGASLTIVDCVQTPCGGPDKDPVAGQFLVPGLIPGGYQLTETKAPVGFVLDQTPRTVIVRGDVQVTVLDDIVNRQQTTPQLPFTGGTGTDALLVLGAGLLLLTLGLLIAQHRRRRRTTTTSPTGDA
ncbi:MAG: SpaA isopeptide-forming pilin-related protein [Candidatus Microbacterium colombiense]|nr:MAG: SpaA isopeptide-forming pilin-related protein [Microbacterium sp.]